MGAVTSLVRNPSKTRIPIFDDAAPAESVANHARLKKTISEICRRFRMLNSLVPL